MPAKKFQLTRNREIHKQLSTIVIKQVKEMVARIEDSVTQCDNSELTHEARTLIKQLRAIWRMVRPVIDEATYQQNNRLLRDTARQLSASRDVFVAAETVKALIEDHSAPDLGPLVEALIGIIKQEVKATLPAEQQRAAMAKVAQALQQTAAQLAQLSPKRSGWPIIGAGLKATYRQARRRRRQANRLYRDTDFHDWRKSTKALWYQTRLIESSWPGYLKKFIKRLKQIESLLGDEHDLTMLCQRLTADPSQFGGQQSVTLVISALHERRKSLRKQVLKLSARTFRRKPKRFINRLAKHWEKN